jgi:hypothetical protein
VGVSKVLQQLGIIKVGETRTAGSSSGALAQLVDHPYGPTHDEFAKGAVDFVNYCRTGHKCVDHLDEVRGWGWARGDGRSSRAPAPRRRGQAPPPAPAAGPGR